MAKKKQIAKLYDNLFKDLTVYRLARNQNIKPDTRCALMRIRAKLQIINILGGRKLAEELLALFQEFDEQRNAQRDKELEKEDGSPKFFTPLNLTGAFDMAADRIIDGWYS